MTDLYAVIGNPIEHSKSPQIHAMFAEQTGQDIFYSAILGDPDGFAGDVLQFMIEGGQGMNVTVPFKQEAFELVDAMTERARIAGAVNTLMLTGNDTIGDNTDGAGLVRDLGCNNSFNFQGATILLLGAGGASRGVLHPLIEEGPARIVIANRTASKAQELAEIVADMGVEVVGCGLDELQGQQFDLIINGTSAGLNGEVPPIPEDCLKDGGWTYDMMYGSEPTAFVKWGQAHGAAKALDGLGMLVEQAAESFLRWRNVMPDTESVIKALREGM